MHVFRRSYVTTPETVLATRNTDSDGVIIGKAGCRAVSDAADAGNVRRLRGTLVRVPVFRITHVSQIQTAPTLPQYRQIAAFAHRFHERGKSVLFVWDNSELSGEQFRKRHVTTVREWGTAGVVSREAEQQHVAFQEDVPGILHRGLALHVVCRLVV